jgi:outer membrane protein assembly factor BamB
MQESVIADSRYYSGVRDPRTTISCVAGAVLCLTLRTNLVQTQSAEFAFPLESRWSLALPSPPIFPPAYDRSRAYIPLRDGSLTAVDLEDGRAAWHVEAAASAPPAAGEDLVFVGTKNAIEARSSGDGSARWRVPIDGDLSAPLVWNTGWLIAATDRSELLALRGLDGAILWRRSLSSATRIAPAVGGARLYVTPDDAHVVALALQTGEPVWTRRLGGPAADTLVSGDRLFVGASDNYLYNLATRDGTIAWRWRTGGDIVGTAAVDAARVYFVSLDNELRALDRRGGALRWQRPVPIRPSAGPLQIGATLIVAGVAAELRAYRTSDGAPAGEFAVKSPEGDELYFAATPHVVESPRTAIIVLTRNGVLQELVPSPR